MLFGLRISLFIQSAIFYSIIKYVAHLQRKYQPPVIIVLYGYPDEVQGCTKIDERMKRSRIPASTDRFFNHTLPTI